MRDIVKTARRPPTGRMADRIGGLAQGFRTALRGARDALIAIHGHRHAPRAWPKTLGNRLYESISRTFGISHRLIKSQPHSQ